MSIFSVASMPEDLSNFAVSGRFLETWQRESLGVASRWFIAGGKELVGKTKLAVVVAAGLREFFKKDLILGNDICWLDVIIENPGSESQLSGGSF